MTTATTAKYPLRQLGKNGPFVSALGFGTMGIGAWYGKASSDDDAFKAFSYAADRGMTHFDCADIYGTAEAALGRWFEKTGRRSDIFLATKFGAYDMDLGFEGEAKAISKPSYIRRALQRSLEQLKTDYIDLYYQHQVDPSVPIEVVIETLREFVDAGKIKWLGLSECNADTLRRAKAVKGVGDKIIAVQVEYSPFTLDIEKDGLAAAANELGVSVVAFSPLGRGLVTGQYKTRADFGEGDIRLWLPRWSEENFPKNLVVVDKIKAIADKYKCTPSQVTLAWILAEHPTWVAIPGSRSTERIEENARGAELQLSSDAVKDIRQLAEAAETAGGRYGFEVPNESMPLSEWKGE